jgi:hypothetical protein
MFSLDEVEVTCYNCLEDFRTQLDGDDPECPYCGATVPWDDDIGLVISDEPSPRKGGL